jgi:small ligand-binding sensory domain FIST
VIAIGDVLANRERIRFHVRDARSAREDLELLLSPQEFDVKAQAALVFACNGRGRGLHGRADGDITVLQESLGGSVPTAGMFCAGEIGPVGGRNFLHGHTASIAILRSGIQKS